MFPWQLVCFCTRRYFYSKRLNLQEEAEKWVWGLVDVREPNGLICHSSWFPYWKGSGNFRIVLNWRSADMMSGCIKESCQCSVYKKKKKKKKSFPAQLLSRKRLTFQRLQVRLFASRGSSPSCSDTTWWNSIIILFICKFMLYCQSSYSEKVVFNINTKRKIILKICKYFI